MTSGPRPLTRNLGKLNPEKGGVTGLFWKGEGQAEEVSGKTGESKNKMALHSCQPVHVEDEDGSGSGSVADTESSDHEN